MPSKTEAPSLLSKLNAQLQECETVTELFKLANSEDFRKDAHTLEADELTSLRAAYRAAQQKLDGKIKLETFDGQVINVVDVDWWHSDQFNNDGVTIRFQPESDLGRTYKALTSSAPVVRFFDRLGFVPTKENPIRVLVKLEPVSDPKRAAQGQRIWTIKRLPSATDRAELPF